MWARRMLAPGGSAARARAYTNKASVFSNFRGPRGKEYAVKVTDFMQQVRGSALRRACSLAVMRECPAEARG